LVDFLDLEQKLQQNKIIKLPDDGSKRGAVIVPVFKKSNELHLLFTKRTENLKFHKGQISFPGGKMEKKDYSLFECALRETYEEIGVPRNYITLLGELSQLKTRTSNILLSSFVCKFVYPFPLTINKHEVKEIIKIPLNAFFKKNSWSNQSIILDDELIEVWFFKYQDYIIWGATAEILQQLISLF